MKTKHMQSMLVAVKKCESYAAVVDANDNRWTDALASQNEALMIRMRRDIKHARSALSHNLNTLKQIGGSPNTVAFSERALARCDTLLALFHDALSVIGRDARDRVLRELRAVISRDCGKERYDAWWAEAETNAAAATQVVQERRSVSSMVVHVGSSGTAKERK